jgi:flagellar basal-body rod protein FlgB
MPNAIDQILFDKTAIPRLSRALDITAARQRLLTENVANAETPGYVRKDIDFAAELKAARDRTPSIGMKVTRPGHHSSRTEAGSFKITRVKPESDAVSAVQLDQEMAQVAQNQLEYNISAQLARGKFDHLKLAIRGRR